MTEMRELVRMLNELDEEMVQCVRCGMCQAACPLYAETGRETDVARGKLVLVENLSKEILKDPEAVKDRLDKCLLCGSCAAACPSGVITRLDRVIRPWSAIPAIAGRLRRA